MLASGYMLIVEPAVFRDRKDAYRDSVAGDIIDNTALGSGYIWIKISAMNMKRGVSGIFTNEMSFLDNFWINKKANSSKLAPSIIESAKTDMPA